MPPRKRKSVATDTESGSDYVTPSKSVRRRPTATASASRSKRRPSSSNTKDKGGKEGGADPGIANYVSKLVTAEYTEVQTRSCQNYDSSVTLPEKCITCIEKQSILGSCRFAHLRVFRKLENGKIDYSDFAFRSNLDLPRRSRAAPLRKRGAPKSRLEVPSTRRVTRSRGAVVEEVPPVIVLDDESTTATPVIVLEDSPMPAMGDGVGSGNAVALATETASEELGAEIGVVPAEAAVEEVKVEAGALTAGITIEGQKAETNGPLYNEAIPKGLEVEAIDALASGSISGGPKVEANGTSTPETPTQKPKPEANSSLAVGATREQLSLLANKPTPEELKAEAEYVLPLIAPTFAGQLHRELRHESTHLGHLVEGEALARGSRPLIRILSIPETRSLCDICTTSIFMGGYMCGCCGRELCLGCWEEWKPSDMKAGSRFRRIDTCSRRRRHIRDSMVFVTRAVDGEILKLLARVESHIPSAEKEAQETGDANLGIESIPTEQPIWPDDKLKYLATPKTPYSTITLQQFQSLWRRGGIPLVLTGFLDRFKLPWDPAYFIRHYGSESCYVHDCKDSKVVDTFVADFFTGFGNPTSTSYKLKDWPPSDDFAITFPELFKDFENALPFPSYTARKGALNLAAHFPEGYNAPDLGPKMYNAYPAPDFLSDLLEPNLEQNPPRVKGTTNLHLDLTDAMNIMLFSAGGEHALASYTTSKAIPTCGAIWDIFPPSASAHLRSYLNSTAYLSAHKQESAEYQDDPIHRQLYYLSEDDLAALYKNHGVMSHRIYQEPGDAVFIPAGCAHQVRNRKSCVKVAVDFLTPENVRVCKGLVEEGRGMRDEWRGQGGAGKEDVLQLWSCLGFAWQWFERVLGEVEGKGKGKGREDVDTPMSNVGNDQGGIVETGQHTRTEIEVMGPVVV